MRSNKPQSRLLVRGSVLYHDFVFRRRNRWYHWVAGLGLWLLSWLYRAALVLRRSWPEPAVRVPCRVISVGNLVIGGSGKTPVVGWLARALRERGLTTAVLCRGHGGAWVHQARVFHDGVEMHGSATDGGDEAAMLATRLAGLGIPILVGRRRADTARLACERFHPDVLLIDDGLQHGSLEKDYEIVTFNGSNPIGVGQVLPFGPLREPTSALERCHCVWLTRSEVTAPPEPLQALVEARRFVSSAYRAVGVRGLDEPLRLLPIESLRGRRLVAFSGIATPESFFDQLDDLGYDVRERVRFPDHHWFDAVDLRQLRDAVARQGATALVTTEKDLVRLPPDRDSSIYALVVEVAPHHDRDAIVGWVMGES